MPRCPIPWPQRSSNSSSSRGANSRRSGRSKDGQGEVREDEAPRERGDHRSRGPRQDHSDGGAHEGVVRQGPREVRALRRSREGVGVAGTPRRHQDPDDRDVARGVLDEEPPLRARRLSRPRRLREEHDHRRGADGRRHPGGLRGGRSHAADPRAHPARAPGRRAEDRRLPQQGRRDRRSGAPRAGRDGGARAPLEVRRVSTARTPTKRS
jgi:hypothetical protein